MHCLIDSALHSHAPCKVPGVDHIGRPGNGGWLLDGNAEVCAHGGGLVSADHAFQQLFVPAALSHAVQVFHEVHDIFLCHLSVGSLHDALHALGGHLGGDVPQAISHIVIGLVLIVVPLEQIQDGERKTVVFCHIRRVGGEHIKDGVDHHTVVGIGCQCLGCAHVQQPEDVRLSGLRVRHGKVVPVHIDWVIELLGKLPVSEPCHGDLVAPFRAGSVQKLLQLLCNLDLTVR